MAATTPRSMTSGPSHDACVTLCDPSGNTLVEWAAELTALGSSHGRPHQTPMCLHQMASYTCYHFLCQRSSSHMSGKTAAQIAAAAAASKTASMCQQYVNKTNVPQECASDDEAAAGAQAPAEAPADDAAVAGMFGLRRSS